MKRGFTMIELLLAVVLLGVMTVVSIVSFHAVVRGWQGSTEYVDKLQHTDYAIDQLVSALKCAYYPTNGEQTYDHGFVLHNKGDGDSPRESDVIEWSKLGTAIIGSKSSAGDSVHRIQLQVLEKGDNTWLETIERTGLYARVKPTAKVIPLDQGASDSLGFDNDELYQPILVADGVVGFNCQVIPTKPENSDSDAELDASKFEDEYDKSNSVPYTVQLTMFIEKPDSQFLSQTRRMPLIRIVRMPIHDQSLDGKALPGEDNSDGKGGSKSSKGGKK